jgi:hypothetical protein
MELDDFKTNPNRVGNQHAQQQHLTTEMIDKMIQRKYYAKMQKIVYPEMIGIAICLITAIFIALNFYKLDTAFLKGVGVSSIFLLITLSVISLLSLQPFQRIRNVHKPVVETLKTFTTNKFRFYKLQKLNITLSYLLLVTIIVLLSKLFNGIDLTNNKYFWIFSFTIGYLFVFFYSKWVLKYYQKTIRQTEELLQAINE